MCGKHWLDSGWYDVVTDTTSSFLQVFMLGEVCTNLFEAHKIRHGVHALVDHHKELCGLVLKALVDSKLKLDLFIISVFLFFLALQFSSHIFSSLFMNRSSQLLKHKL